MINEEKIKDLMKNNIIIDFYNDKKLIFDYQLNENHYNNENIKIKIIEYYFLIKYKYYLNDFIDRKYLLIDNIMKMIFGENEYEYSSFRFFKNRDEDDEDYYQNQIENIEIDFLILY